MSPAVLCIAICFVATLVTSVSAEGDKGDCSLFKIHYAGKTVLIN